MHTKLLAITLMAFFGLSGISRAQSEGKKSNPKTSDDAAGLTSLPTDNPASTLVQPNGNSSSPGSFQSDQLQTPSQAPATTPEPAQQPAILTKPE